MNQLGNESSLYLRQHADNPVHWHPWNEEALSEAREQGKPILLSIGYSACHWCHVMAHESFEDGETAALMNAAFVNIKVDREERPDLDRIYQLSHQLLTGRGGGWPLTVFLEPHDLVPFFAGTYFPVQARYGMPAFKDALVALHQWFKEHREEVRGQNAKLQDALKAIHNPVLPDSAIISQESGQQLFQKTIEQIKARHDSANGGYGGAPKFPQAPLLNAVAALGDAGRETALHRGLEFTLVSMARSGLRDHLDGGFFRYCVDDSWTIPHFEKMLYDNAMLLPLYAESARKFNNPELEKAATGIVDWLQSVMRQESGGYAASIDADAGGQEGAFHVWKPDQVRSIIGGKPGEIFIRHFALDQPPNFEGEAWHLQQSVPITVLSEEFQEKPAATQDMLDLAVMALREARENRVHPALDSKQLTSWNALLAEGFVRAGRALQRDDWLDHADDILNFIEHKLWNGSCLMAVFNAGVSRFEAYLDDYAFLLNALTLFLQVRWTPEKLRFSIELADTLLARFENTENGGFYFSDSSVDVPITRSMIFQDDATPAGNAIAIRALNRLGRLLGETRYTDAAERCMQRAMSQLPDSPLAHSSLIIALQDSLVPPPHLVISGTSREEQLALKRWADGLDQVDCYLIGTPDHSLPGILSEYRSEDPVTAWLCRGLHCLPPVCSQEELEQQLDN